MKRECKFVLSEEETTCIGDVRRVKNAISRIILNIDTLNKEEIVEVLKTSDEGLAIALKKLEIN